MTDIPFPQAGAPENVVRPPQQPPRDALTPGMLDALAKTKPWVRFIAVLCYITVALMGIGALVMIGLGLFQMKSKGVEGMMAAGLGVLYFAFAILYIFPAHYLSRYATSIGHAIDSPSKSYQVEQALRHQKSFWKFAGVMSLVMILLYIPGIFAAIAIPNLMTAMQRSKQKRTMADMRQIATSLESRAVETDDFPQVATMEELAKQLEPRYIDKLPRVDGWGRVYHYEATDCETGKCQSYVIVSAAKDGGFEHDSPLEYVPGGKQITQNVDQDIVMANGAFLRHPEIK